MHLILLQSSTILWPTQSNHLLLLYLPIEVFSSLFRGLTKCTAGTKVEWQPIKAAVASSTARVWRLKRIGVPNNGKKVAPWWNQDVKDAIRAKIVACKAAEQNWIFFTCAVYAEARKFATFVVKNSNSNFGRYSDINRIPVPDKPTKCSGKRSSVSSAKGLMLLDPAKTKTVSYSAIRRTSMQTESRDFH